MVASCWLRGEPPSVPGAGLAIRIPGPITREKLDLLRQVDAVYLDEIRKASLYDEVWQAFIINEVRGINRVTYDITSKPPGTIEWE